MNKLVFTVTKPKTEDIASLLKAVSKINCRIFLDIENNKVEVLDVSDEMIDSVIELVHNHYTLLGVDIDNLGFKQNTCQNFNTASPENSFQNLDINLESQMIEYAIKQLITVSNKVLHKEVHEKSVTSHIWTAIKEMSQRFLNDEIVPCCLGDIVDCYLGTHLPGEVGGSHVPCLVINICDNVIFVAPIVKQLTYESHSNMPYKVPNDVIFTDSNYKSGILILDKARYINHNRIQKVIGKATVQYMQQVLQKLNTAFDFTTQYSNILVASPSASNVKNNADSKDEEDTFENKAISSEAILNFVLSDSLSKISNEKSITANVPVFLENIGMSTSNPLVNEAFMAAFEVKKITYDTIAANLYIKSHSLTEDEIKAILKENFKNWLATKEELKNLQRISFTSLLKVFVKACQKI